MTFGEAGRHSRNTAGNPMLAALGACRGALTSLFIFSCLINILMLTGSFYMLQVYDRVLMSNSVPTLVMLSLIALAAYLFQGFLDVIRTRIFGRIAERVDVATGPELYTRLIRQQASRPGLHGEPMQPFRDLEAIRIFLSGTGPVAIFDMPWLPIYLILCFVLHPAIGIFATLSALLLIVVAFFSEWKSHRPMLAAFDASAKRNLLATASLQGSEAIQSMGMLSTMRQRWAAYNDRHSTLALRANDVSSGLSASSRTLRMVIQSATLGLGAYLVIRGEMTPGTIIAASVISARAIAPVDMAMSSYRSFQAARQGFLRLSRLFQSTPEREDLLRLLAPHRSLKADNIIVVSPNDGRPILKGISLHVTAGQGLGIIGHSASGKSTLGRALVGLWQPMRGTVALDGASLTHWNPELLGRHIGYLPHDVQLFDGTIAENISRFEADPPPEAIHKAAQSAGCHEMILSLPEGFNTRVGNGGAHLSAGQRQRIGLARALYGEPFLVLLDEPNANLDSSGEQAVTAAIGEIRARGGIAIVIAHRPSAIVAVDHLMILANGVATAYGRKDEVLRDSVTNAGAIQSAANAAVAARTKGNLPPRAEPKLAPPQAGSAGRSDPENGPQREAGAGDAA